MCKEDETAINTDDFENSAYFDDLYNKRIQYFSAEMVMDIIQARQIVKFDSLKVKNFPTKLDKIEYMFWKRYKTKDNEYGYFGVGFMSAGKKTDKNYPNTFFFRVDDDYMKYQEVVLPLSIIKKVKTVRKNLKFIGNRFGNVQKKISISKY